MTFFFKHKFFLSKLFFFLPHIDSSSLLATLFPFSRSQLVWCVYLLLHNLHRPFSKPARRRRFCLCNLLSSQNERKLHACRRRMGWMEREESSRRKILKGIVHLLRREKRASFLDKFLRFCWTIPYDLLHAMKNCAATDGFPLILCFRCFFKKYFSTRKLNIESRGFRELQKYEENKQVG